MVDRPTGGGLRSSACAAGPAYWPVTILSTRSLWRSYEQ